MLWWSCCDRWVTRAPRGERVWSEVACDVPMKSIHWRLFVEGVSSAGFDRLRLQGCASQRARAPATRAVSDRSSKSRGGWPRRRHCGEQSPRRYGSRYISLAIDQPINTPLLTHSPSCDPRASLAPVNVHCRPARCLLLPCLPHIYNGPVTRLKRIARAVRHRLRVCLTVPLLPRLSQAVDIERPRLKPAPHADPAARSLVDQRPAT